MSVELRSLDVRHPSAASGDAHALTGLTLSIAQGEQIALVGPSGAGKTTLLHTLACAQKPDAGQFTLFGAEPWKLSHRERHALRRQLFLAPQMPPLPPRQRVVTAVLAGRLPQWNAWQAFMSLLRPRDVQAAYEALVPFNLQDKLYARVDRLSGGERQRCSMARLLVSDAQAFLVDEPLSALDPALAQQTLGVLQREAATRNATLICSLHQVELARAAFPRLLGLRDGRIVFDAKREHVTDAMITELYRNTIDASPFADADLLPDPQASIGPRCF